jgi:hypothetical protein
MTTVVRTAKRQRSFVGKMVKWTFITFNVLMLLWLVSGMTAVSSLSPSSDAERAGHIIGATIGFSMIIILWFIGDIILGLFVLLTRGDLVVVEETSGNSGTSRKFSKAEVQGGMPDPDAIVSRYLQRAEAPAPRAQPSTTFSAQSGFGRRR